MILKNLCLPMLWTKVALSLEGLIEGLLNYNVRPEEMKMWSLNRGGLLMEVAARAGLTVY